MHVKNIRKNDTKGPDFQQAAIAIYRSLIIRLNSQKKKT